MAAPASSAFRSCAAGCALVGGAVVALVVLVALNRPAPPAPLPAPPGPPRATPTPTSEPPRGPRRPPGSFERKEDHRQYTMTWGFTDHHGEAHEVSCRIARDDHAREVSGFGYQPEAIDAAWAGRLREWALKELREHGLEGVVTLEVNDDGWRARHQLPPNMDPGEAARLDAEARRFYRFMELRFSGESDAVTNALVRERGLRLEGGRLGIDYDGLADRAAGPLADCHRALRWAAGRGGDRRLLEVVLAFLQEIPYEVPPNSAGRTRTLGLYVPTEVLVGNHGDCDSKSVTFAALWRRIDVPLILVRVPGHMLLGVAVRPGPGERFVRLGNRYFVLCEVAGPAKSRPGRTNVEGSFEYVVLEPAGS